MYYNLGIKEIDELYNLSVKSSVKQFLGFQEGKITPRPCSEQNQQKHFVSYLCMYHLQSLREFDKALWTWTEMVKQER